MKKLFSLFTVIICVLFITGCGVKVPGKIGKIGKKDEPKKVYKYDMLFYPSFDYKFDNGYTYVPVGDNSYIIMDKDGVLIDKPAKSSKVKQYDGSYFGVEFYNKANNYILYKKGDKVVKLDGYTFETDYNELFFEGLAAVRDSSGVGFVDKDLNVVIKPKYRSVSRFQNGRAFATRDNKTFLIDKTGKEIFSFDDDINYMLYNYSFENGRCPVKKNGIMYYIDVNGKKVSKDYKFVGIYSNGLAPVEINGKIGFMDINEKLVIPAIYDRKTLIADRDVSINYPFESGYGVVSKNGKWGVIDKKGKVLIDFKYTSISPIIFDIFNCRTGSFNSETVDIKGNKYHYVHEVMDGKYASVENGGKYYLIDKNKNILYNTKYDSIQDQITSDYKYIYVKLNGKEGYIDRNGKFTALPEGATLVRTFYKDGNYMAIRTADGKIGYLEGGTNKVVALDNYEDAYVMVDDRAFVYKDFKLYVINSAGKTIIDNSKEG